MSQNRGAKGSLNDRIISMLYRQRYGEYLKKKQAYNKKDRKQASEYLQNIRTFDIDNDNSAMEKQDKHILEDAFKPLNDVEILPTIKPEKQDKLNTVKEAASTVTLSSEPLSDSLDIKTPQLEKHPILDDKEIQTLTQLGNQVTQFDPTTEDYDFDKFDYYEIITRKSKVAGISDDDVIDVDKEISKREDEATIIDEVTKFVDESKELLSEIKFEINDVKDSLPEQYTQEDISKLEERYLALKAKLDILKEKYLTIKEKYDFEDYHILNSLALMTAIDDYRDKAKLDELDAMVDFCKGEIEQIDGVLVEEKRRKSVGEDIEKKHQEIKKRDNQFEHSKRDTIYLDSLEQQIAKESEKQREIINNIWKTLNKVELKVVKTTDYIYNTGQMFSSFLRITAGILTAPFSNRGLFGVMLGSGLINRGLRDLRTSLIPKEVERVEIKEKYHSIEREILKTKDVVQTTMHIIDDSLYQLGELQRDFKIKFEPYASYIPEYSKVYTMMEQLEKKLSAKKKYVNEMKKTLDKQYSKNKEKVLRAS